MSFYQFSALLSASVPSRKRSEKYQEFYTKITNAQIQIEEAVIGLCRNVFQANGRIVFGGHPSISPLVKMVASEFRANKDIENIKRSEFGEKPISIFQSRAYEKAANDAVISQAYSEYFDVTWTESKNSESYDPAIEDSPQCHESLNYMRDQMINQNLDAMICMGGMDGVEKEFEKFRSIHPGKPVFVLRTTGGASKIIAEKFADDKNIIVIDRIEYTLDKKKLDEPQKGKFEIIPYSFITSLIVKEILNNRYR